MVDHPDPNILAAVVDGTLEPGQRESLEGHLATCPQCRALVADVGRLQAVDSVRIRRAYPWRITAAAMVLAAAAVFLFTRGGPESTADLMADAIRTLARSEPDLFGEFAPLTEEQRLAPSDLLQRGGPVLLHPSGKTRNPVTFTWRPTTGATGYLVTLTKADGMPVWERAAEEPWLTETVPPGRYLWTVSTQGPLKEESSRHFEAAGAQEIADLDEGMRLIDEAAAPLVRELLKAQFSTSLGFHRDAERWARSALEKLPDDPLARETLYHVLNQVGSPEAEQVLQD